MSKFDKEVNNILASKIKKMEKRLNKKRKGRIKPPNTPDNRATNRLSPALGSGMHSDPVVSQTPTPTGIDA